MSYVVCNIFSFPLNGEVTKTENFCSLVLMAFSKVLKKLKDFRHSCT